ncbi:MAG: hypothetical protein JWN04_5073 [Myxococcaceae bacterium]|nr:hypothetical protein [Myxococcaceae bacterium]
MRMQLNSIACAAIRRCSGSVVVLIVLASVGSAGRARAEGTESTVDITSTVYHEKGGPLQMNIVNPAVAANVAATEMLSIQAGWEADVVSGASVAVVDAPGGGTGGVDAITSATKVHDLRQLISGGATLRGDTTRLAANYAYGFESDYRSNGLSVSAATELFERNTTLEISYGRGWDSVCDLAQPQAEKPVDRQRMPTHDGCFEKNKGRVERAIDLHSLQGAWTQAWTPIFSTQWSVSAQLISGFQSNPYRAVWLGRAAAQEHHPNQRARYESNFSGRLWLRPIGGALQLAARVYRDDWDLRAASGEAAYERGIGSLFRLRLRSRYYQQTGAAFYSDDYSLAPRGQYFTGDRELSPMHSWLAGARLDLTPGVVGPGHALSLFDTLRFVLKGDYLVYDFTQFHYGNAAVPNRRAIFATVSVDATF